MLLCSEEMGYHICYSCRLDAVQAQERVKHSQQRTVHLLGKYRGTLPTLLKTAVAMGRLLSYSHAVLAPATLSL